MSDDGLDPDRLNEKSRGAWVLGWLWMAFAAFNIIDILRHPWERSSAYAGAILLLVSGFVYVISLRPRLSADTQRVRIRNPFRDIVIPWGAVTEVDSRDTIRVHTEHKPYHSWVGHVPNRRRSRYSATSIRARDAEASIRSRGRGIGVPRTGGSTAEGPQSELANRTSAEFIAERLQGMADRFSRTSREAGESRESVRWSWEAGVAICLPAVLVVLSFVIP